MNIDADRMEGALSFVRKVELPRAPRDLRDFGSGSAQTIFDQVKNQATVVGSSVVSFVTGVTAENRRDIVNCSLLAQLAANKAVPSREDIRAWYEAYFDALSHLGWVIQERGFAQYREGGDDFEANKAVLSVAAVLFGAAPTALAVVQSTLDAMKSMAGGPWITIFRRESQSAKAGRFQITLVEPTRDNGFTVALMAFELEATAALAQVLFFKFRSSEVTLRHASGSVTIDGDILTAVRSAIAEKISAYTRNYIADVPL
jgi:hypothetical protein